jgi:agmatinase
MRLPYVPEPEGSDTDVAIVGIPFDTAASFRPGARFAPSAIRDISVLLRPSNQFHGINAFDELRVVDAGDVIAIPGDIHRTYDNIRDRLIRLLDAGILPASLGGDHSVALGELRAMHARYGPVGLVQFDSHSDTWDNYWGLQYTHGTPFRRACEEGLLDTGHSIQFGLRGSEYAPGDLDETRGLGFEVLTTEDLRILRPEEAAQAILKRTAGRPVFLSFDIDFFDPAFAPGTGTPEVGGPTSAFGLQVLRRLRGLDLRGFDVVEVLPAHDQASITSLLAATVVFELLALVALNRTQRP